MWNRKNDDREPKPAVGTRVVSYIAVTGMSLAQVAAVILYVADASRELAAIPWSGQGAERAPLEMTYTEFSTGHADLAITAMGKRIGGVRYLGEDKSRPYDIVFTDVSSGACGTCT